MKVHDGLHLVVHNQNERGADRPESVSSGALEERGTSLLREDLLEAVGGTLVHPLGGGLLRLHLKATTDRVERVGGVSRKDGNGLRDHELRSQPLHALVVLVGVLLAEGVVQAEVHTAVGDDTHHGNAETVVETQHALGPPCGTAEAVPQAVEVALSGAHVGRKTGTAVRTNNKVTQEVGGMRRRGRRCGTSE